MQYFIVGNEDGEKNLTIVVPGDGVKLVHSSHPKFDEIVQGVLNDDESVLGLISREQQVAEKFERLSDRVTVANGRVYFDGDEVDNALTTQILRFVDEDAEVTPLVRFWENLAQNPNEFCREQLYTWEPVQDGSLTITSDGLIVGYKGVRKTGENEFESINTGTATVNGERKTGAIPNPIGAVVEMPRSQVVFDPEEGCSRGLHVGTYRYANSFARGGLLEVHVNPRDVVSVPTDSSAQKMRVCRYTVVATSDAPYTVAVLPDDNEWRDDEENLDYCDSCGCELDSLGDCDCGCGW